MLDELDRELERRGHRYLRYADDCNIYVRSKRTGQRVMEGITRFITNKLRLKVNETKRLLFSFRGVDEVEVPQDRIVAKWAHCM